MAKNLPAWGALVICALTIVAIAALTALHDAVPDVLNLLAIGALTGGAGLAVPTSTTETIRTSSAAARPAAAPAPRPAPSSTGAAA